MGIAISISHGHFERSLRPGRPGLLEQYQRASGQQPSVRRHHRARLQWREFIAELTVNVNCLTGAGTMVQQVIIEHAFDSITRRVRQPLQ
jgi:hypothetical protein